MIVPFEITAHLLDHHGDPPVTSREETIKPRDDRGRK
jgi:hypothetical protein